MYLTSQIESKIQIRRMPSTSLQEKEHGESYVEFLRRLFALKGVPQLMMFSACMSFGIGMYAIVS